MYIWNVLSIHLEYWVLNNLNEVPLTSHKFSSLRSFVIKWLKMMNQTETQHCSTQGLIWLSAFFFFSSREMQYTPEELLGMMLNYSRGLAQDFAGLLAQGGRYIIVWHFCICQAYQLFFFPLLLISSIPRTTDQRCSDYRPSLFQPGRAQGSPAGCTDVRSKGPSAHQWQHSCGLELWGLQEERHR